MAFNDTTIGGNTARELDAALALLDEVNGQEVSGVIKAAYIPEAAYYVQVDPDDDNDEDEVRRCRLVEQCLNFEACGKGAGGVAAAVIRWHHREDFTVERETRVLSMADGVAAAAANGLMVEFRAALATHKNLASAIKPLVTNFGALAGALMMRLGHHWDAQNTRPQLAFVRAAQLDTLLPEAEFRKVFYLAVHPLPLAVTEGMREKAAKSALEGVIEPVRLRCKAFPAGCALVHVAQTAASALKSEAWIAPYVTQLEGAFTALDEAAVRITREPLRYHVAASMFGADKKDVDWIALKPALVMCVGYVRGVYKGTLANSAALKKFAQENKRSVDLWARAAAKADELSGEDIAQLALAVHAAFATA